MGGIFLKHNYKIYTYIYIHIHISLFTKLLRIHWKHNNNCNETTQLLWLQMHKPTHLDTPWREKMKWDYINEMKWDETRWNEMKWNHVMLCYHVMSARVVYGLAAWPYPKSEICSYVFTPMLSGLRWPGQTVMGSWPPADTLWLRALHTQQAAGARFCEQKRMSSMWLFKDSTLSFACCCG